MYFSLIVICRAYYMTRTSGTPIAIERRTDLQSIWQIGMGDKQAVERDRVGHS
jgi:hypothetical protein